VGRGQRFRRTRDFLYFDFVSFRTPVSASRSFSFHVNKLLQQPFDCAPTLYACFAVPMSYNNNRGNFGRGGGGGGGGFRGRSNLKCYRCTVVNCYVLLRVNDARTLIFVPIVQKNVWKCRTRFDCFL